jgi:xanthine dehydrogenase YagS FAD-binding subunit
MTDMMHNFELFQPGSLSDAQALLKKHGDDAWLIAGGKDSLDWFKDRVKTPSAVIDISDLAELKGGVSDESGGVYISAMTTLTDVAENPLIKERFPLLADAAGRVASPQIRNVGTIGGNVCQDTRCLYYRDGFPCYRAGGNTCYANTPTAMNREHTLFEAKRCVAVTPSDTAPALVVLEAEMLVKRGKKDLVIPAEDFFIGPEIDIERMTALEAGDILMGIRIPAKWAKSHQYFEKVADRQTWDFALVSIAMVATKNGDSVSDLRMACGAVQCTPRRLTNVEDLLIGEVPNEEMETLTGRVASSGAKPLNYNHFKEPLMASLAKRAVRSLSS